jgi:CRP-like cAMP-binding protein/CheY-like chemotaxis protein
VEVFMITASLQGHFVLVAEDEYVLAMELQQTLRGAGATVVGPAPSIGQALHLIDIDRRIDAAVLDVNLGGQMVFPVAERLKAAGVPIIFATGYGEGDLPAHLRDVPRCEKPLEVAHVARTVRSTIDATGNRLAEERLGRLPSAERSVRLEGNLILGTLPKDSLALLAPHLEPVALQAGMMLETPEDPIRHVYFPTRGVGSVMASDDRGHRIEVGLFGREGMSGLAVVLGHDRSPYETRVQVPGHAYRIAVEALRGALPEPGLHRVFLRYAQAFSIQVAHTALANGRHTIEERLARWLLMCLDRLGGDTIDLTHEFLAVVLGVRRSGVTVAMHMLEGRRLIRSTRGRVRILDRVGIEALAGGSYGIPEAQYERLIGDLRAT